ncbi:hypothetical protein Goshw_013301 [Gossypium schwendimanii]|uniref:Uncharacterized protein n=1 Tax=Gossypium schwendimanii TaxID=34291 RepID=A0A7J9MTX5_GOSSC|nr:hypothetical protein [Gossypium schwendimanii]
MQEAKDYMPTPGSSFVPQDNVALENELYTQVFSLDKYGKVLGYRRGMTKSWLFSIHLFNPCSISSINALLEEAKSRFRAEAAEREAHLISVEERFMKLTKIREAKFMDMMDAREKKYKALLNKFEFHTRGLDDEAFSSDDDE